MRKCFTRAFALVMAVLTLVSQMVFVSVADVAEVQCTCDPATRTGEVHDHIDPTCGDYGYDLYVCDECGGSWTVLTDVPTEEHIYNIEKATCTEAMFCTECGYVAAEATGHNYEDVVVEATCDEDGYTSHSCLNCGDYFTTDIVPAIGHNWQLDEDASYPCSCNVDGLNVYKCANCDLTRDEVITAPGKHINYEADYVEATCYEGGYTIHTCNVCGYELIAPDPNAPAKGHTFVDYEAQASTCTEAGWYAYQVCTECNYSTFEEDPADGHVEGEVVIENDTTSTCEEDGSYDEVVYCTKCDYEFSRVTVTVPATNHEGEEVVENEVAPTCEEDGSYDVVVYCVKCDAELSRDTVVVPAIGHNFEVTTVAPTCSERGYDNNVCLNEGCGLVFKSNYVAIDPLSHNGVLEGRVEATCTSEGFTGSLVCSDCDRVLNRGVVIPMLDHVLTAYEGVEPTCTVDGYEAYVECANCDYTTYEVLPALGHVQEESLGILAPTCTDGGYTIWKCTRVLDGEVCGEIFYTDHVDALGHTVIVDEAVAATCTETGLTEGSHCDVCDEVLVAQEVVEALGHVEVVDAAVEPTCTETGLTEGSHCEVCGEVLVAQEVVEALGHVEGTPVSENIIDATCTETGSYDEVVYCEVCSEILSTTVIEIPANGHTPGRCVVENVVEATCTETGSYDEVTYCDVCFEAIETVNVVTPALGHTIAENVTPATEEAVGYVDSYCSVCGEDFGREYLDECVTFTYEAYGINGEAEAINSGYITVEVYANVETDYARIFGVDVDLTFDSKLTFVEANGAMFNNFVVNSYENGIVKFTTDMGLTEGTKVFANGKHLVATLTFKVAGDFYAADAVFAVGAECVAARDTSLVNDLHVDFGTGVVIHVARLGDLTGDGKLTVEDSNAFYEWFKANQGAYNFVIDMDKDGTNSLADLALLRGAIVHNDAYLDA